MCGAVHFFFARRVCTFLFFRQALFANTNALRDKASVKPTFIVYLVVVLYLSRQAVRAHKLATFAAMVAAG